MAWAGSYQIPYEEAAPPAGDQEPSLVGGKLVNRSLLLKHLVGMLGALLR